MRLGDYFIWGGVVPRYVKDVALAAENPATRPQLSDSRRAKLRRGRFGTSSDLKTLTGKAYRVLVARASPERNLKKSRRRARTSRTSSERREGYIPPALDPRCRGMNGGHPVKTGQCSTLNRPLGGEALVQRRMHARARVVLHAQTMAASCGVDAVRGLCLQPEEKPLGEVEGGGE